MKTTTIEIEGKPFVYLDEIDDISYDTIGPISESEARFLLESTSKLFSQIGLKFYLAFGTLLGAIRDKSLIKGDEDVDIFIEDETTLRNNLPWLSDQGYRVCRIADGRLYSFRINESCGYIDVYIRRKLSPSIWSIWCTCLYDRAVPRRLLERKTKIEFLGAEYLIPKKTKKLLAFWYGNTWETPKQGAHTFTYDVASHHWWVTKGQYKYQKLKQKVTRMTKGLFSVSSFLNE